jgi:hypothetical protein
MDFRDKNVFSKSVWLLFSKLDALHFELKNVQIGQNLKKITRDEFFGNTNAFCKFCTYRGILSQMFSQIICNCILFENANYLEHDNARKNKKFSSTGVMGDKL